MSVQLPVRVRGQAPRTSGDRVRSSVRTAGELLLTAGVLLLLLCVYELGWTNIEAGRAETALRTQIDADFAAAAPVGSGKAEEVVPDPRPGQGFAFMYIPRLRDKVWAAPIVEGTTKDDLRGAVGHYVSTVMPGQVGNFAVAAHRATNGELFRDIDALRPGDKVYVETATTWYVYQLSSDQIVKPTQTSVILPVPNKPGVKPTERLITLTTCHPRWASYERWIWYGGLVGKLPKSQGNPPGLER